MGLPEISIKFREIVKKLATRASRGIVAIVLKDTAEGGLHVLKSEDDIPSGLSAKNRGFLEDVFLGNTQEIKDGNVLTETTYKPAKVLAYVLNSSTDETLDKATSVLESQDFNIVCFPEATPTDNSALIKFVKEMQEKGNGIMGVVASDTAPDSEYIVNWQTDGVTRLDGETATKTEYCGRIAGLIAGTPYTQSITYAKLLDLRDIPSITKVQADTAINAGKLIAVKTAGDIRIGRGVTSLTTTDNQNRGNSFKKIKLVQTYNLISNSIRKITVDEFLGKVPNSYANKVLLISAISTFLGELAQEELIDGTFSVEIDMKKQRDYLKKQGVDVNKLTDQEIRMSNTGSCVFLLLRAKAVDAMEDFDIEIEV